MMGTPASATPVRGSGFGWWMATAVTLVNVLTSAGYSVAVVIAQWSGGDHIAKVAAMYAAARSLPLALAVIALVAVRSTYGLGIMATVMAMVQTCDAVVGIEQHDMAKTIGPAVFAIATFVAVPSLLCRHTPVK